MSSSELFLDTVLNDELFDEFNENEDLKDTQKRSNMKIENKGKGRLMRFITSPVLKKKKKTVSALIILFLFSCQRKRKRNETFWNTDTKLKIVVKMGRKKKRKNFTMVNQKRKKRKNKVEQEILSTTLKSIKKWRGYTDINEYCKIDKNRYYRFLKKIGLKYDVYALDLLKNILKLSKTQQLLLDLMVDIHQDGEQKSVLCHLLFWVGVRS
ncbi:hypothetical protein M0813_19578 [Anaeramoeba flamelloides]|uniref:Uncharacterized protein n=1 Tax=Anaeramoeba flamelloides TaxID=1746091 RepID=A0ABQ8YNF1_9EUKA|nr:hypothetical protein M0813_19578 [Anaeramoeba flamelloides]